MPLKKKIYVLNLPKSMPIDNSMQAINSWYFKSYKYVKICKCDFFVLTMLSFHGTYSERESKKTQNGEW